MLILDRWHCLQRCNQCVQSLKLAFQTQDNLVVRQHLAVTVIESVVKDSLRVDTLRGNFVYADSIVKLSLSENKVHWAFKRDKVGNLALVKFGSVYRDADGLKAVMVRYYKKIKK